MYRALTYAILQANIAPDDERSVIRLAADSHVLLEPGTGNSSVYVNGVDVTEYIRSTEVAANVSKVARIKEVRDYMVKQQQEMAKAGGIVMDGRDIGTKVMPHAEVKVYMTATVEERARRRYDELKRKDADITLERLMQDIAARDEMDQNREVSPLVPAEDACIIDTTHLSIDEVVEAIVDLCMRRKEVG